MLRWRLILGTVLISAIAGLCWVDHAITRRGLALLPVILFLALLATGELLHFFKKIGHPLPIKSTYAAVIICLLLSSAPLWLLPFLSESYENKPTASWLLLGVLIGFLITLFSTMHTYHQQETLPSEQENVQGRRTLQLGLGLFTVVYLGGLFGFFVLLRTLSVSGSPNDIGMLALVSMLVVVKMGDTGAYTFGRIFGKHKMAPKLSPGKTWEGTFGGLAASCLGAWLMLAKMPHWLGWEQTATSTFTTSLSGWLTFGLVVGAVGVLGDLTESLLKRDVGVKDSSTWMPGFGGVLDILDSPLLAAPVAYFLWITGAVGP